MILCTLKHYMEFHRINQSTISEYTKISRPTLLQLIRNENQNIKYDTIDELCRFFNIGINDLLIYSPVSIELMEIKHDEYMDTIEVNNEKHSLETIDLVVTYKIDNDLYEFKSNFHLFDLYNENFLLLLTNTISKDSFELLNEKGLDTNFFNLYNELFEVKNKILNQLSIEDNRNIDFLINFDIQNAPNLEEFVEDLKLLPKTQLIQLKKEIDKQLNNAEFLKELNENIRLRKDW